MPLYRWTSLLALCGLVLATLGCSGSSNRANLDENLALRLELDQKSYRPGEAVLCHLTMINQSDKATVLANIDHDSLYFTSFPLEKDGLKKAIRREPVFSRHEETGGMVSLEAGTSSTRTLAFTTLTFDPGQYMLSCYYYIPDVYNPGVYQRVFARSVAYSVEATTPVVHRYSSGIVTREDAINLAAGEAEGDAAGSQARFILDERGFYKWWVNVPAKDSDATTPARSFLWILTLEGSGREATPFEEAQEEDTLPFPEDMFKRQRYRGTE